MKGFSHPQDALDLENKGKDLGLNLRVKYDLI
jgi:hypothetical protein